jgi:hypothetical protein
LRCAQWAVAARGIVGPEAPTHAATLSQRLNTARDDGCGFERLPKDVARDGQQPAGSHDHPLQLAQLGQLDGIFK